MFVASLREQRTGRKFLFEFAKFRARFYCNERERELTVFSSSGDVFRVEIFIKALATVPTTL